LTQTGGFRLSLETHGGQFLVDAVGIKLKRSANIGKLGLQVVYAFIQLALSDTVLLTKVVNLLIQGFFGMKFFQTSFVTLGNHVLLMFFPLIL
jgi:hypothetical protein